MTNVLHIQYTVIYGITNDGRNVFTLFKRTAETIFFTLFLNMQVKL